MMGGDTPVYPELPRQQAVLQLDTSGRCPPLVRLSLNIFMAGGQYGLSRVLSASVKVTS